MKRPRGAAPYGKEWDTLLGKWVDVHVGISENCYGDSLETETRAATVDPHSVHLNPPATKKTKPAG